MFVFSPLKMHSRGCSFFAYIRPFFEAFLQKSKFVGKIGDFSLYNSGFEWYHINSGFLIRHRDVGKVFFIFRGATSCAAARFCDLPMAGFFIFTEGYDAIQSRNNGRIRRKALRCAYHARDHRTLSRHRQHHPCRRAPPRTSAC